MTFDLFTILYIENEYWGIGSLVVYSNTAHALPWLSAQYPKVFEYRGVLYRQDPNPLYAPLGYLNHNKETLPYHYRYALPIRRVELTDL